MDDDKKEIAQGWYKDVFSPQSGTFWGPQMSAPPYHTWSLPELSLSAPWVCCSSSLSRFILQPHLYPSSTSSQKQIMQEEPRRKLTPISWNSAAWVLCFIIEKKRLFCKFRRKLREQFLSLLSCKSYSLFHWRKGMKNRGKTRQEEWRVWKTLSSF